MSIDYAVANFKEWRKAARDALAQERSPSTLFWRDSTMEVLPGLLDDKPKSSLVATVSTTSVPKEFLALATKVACFRDPDRWTLLYRVLWRLSHGEPHLMAIACDDDVRLMQTMAASVRRDIHKMHAFVRFESVSFDGEDHFIAWHRPDHLILEEAAPFFARRFATMPWSIMTADQSVHWNKEKLLFTPGVPRPERMGKDPIEALWRRYYVAIFNPARLKIKMMKKEMAVRYWPTMPETTAISELIMNASTRVDKMSEPLPSALDFIPPNATWDELKAASTGCKGCDLCELGTQTVFGEGPTKASIVFIGEQPGDEEDRQGRPFVGPAGRLLNRALEQAGISREQVYITNVVKHFRFEWKGKIRFHKKPSARHMQACRPWLRKELELIKPKTIICLGATAAQAMLGKAVTIKDVRGRPLKHAAAERLFVTVHPSALLRWPDPATQEAEIQHFIDDLKLATS